MNQSVYFSSRVVNTINALPHGEREAISSALVSEFVLGVEPAADALTPFQTLLYTMIRTYVERDNRADSTH